MIERRQRADAADHHRHRMGVAAEALKKPAHLLVDHGVMDHAIVEILLLRGGRQLAVEQQITGLEKVAVLGEVVDRIAAVKQDTFVAVDERDLRLAARGRSEAGIVSEDAGLTVKLADIHHFGAKRSLVERKRKILVAECQLASFGVRAGFCIHSRILAVRQPQQCGARGPGANRRRNPADPALLAYRNEVCTARK